MDSLIYLKFLAMDGNIALFFGFKCQVMLTCPSLGSCVCIPINTNDDYSLKYWLHGKWQNDVKNISL